MTDATKKKQYISDTELLSEWDWVKNTEIGLNPEKTSHGSTKYAYWICEKGHHYKARIDHRFIMKSGCPYCAGKIPLIGENDLASQYPELVKEWNHNKNSKEPKDYLYGSNKKVWWTCSKCGYEWQTAISHRTKKDTGCPVCAKTQRVKTRNSKFVAQRGSLAENKPELSTEWDYKRNYPLTPKNVTVKSNKKVWWICQTCGFSYSQTIANRSIGEGCPACAGKCVIEEQKNLQSQFPEIVKEWHQTLNGELKPTQVTAFNDKRVWWHCSKCNYDWEATIYSRTRLHTGCPVCAGRVIIKGRNDLLTTHPEIAKQWHPTKNNGLLPSEVSAGSNKSAWWICDQGHEWKTNIATRTRGRGCPECAKKKSGKDRTKTIINQKGSLEDNFPQLAKQWHPIKNKNLTPGMVSSGSSKKVWWQCELGHEWEANINSRTRGNGCPICAKDLFTSFPEQIIFYYLSQVTSTINRHKVNGIEIDIFLPELSVGIEYNGRYYHKDRHEKDLFKIQELAKHGIRIIRIEEGNSNSFNKDVINYKYENRYYRNLDKPIKYLLTELSLPDININIEQDASNIYKTYLTNKQENSFAAKYPHLVCEWNYEKNNGLSPYQVTYGSDKKVWWKCTKCQYEWQAVISSRRIAGCPRCAGKVVTVGVNDLATCNPKLIKEWDYEKNDILPTQVTANNHRLVWWKCSNGHSWRAQIGHRNRGTGCPICYKEGLKKHK